MQMSIKQSGQTLSPMLLSIPHEKAECMVEQLEQEFDNVPLSPAEAAANRCMVERLRALLEFYNA